jgi:uracil phosphoribosyltransferase
LLFLIFLSLPASIYTRISSLMASKDPVPSPAQGVGPVYQPDGEKPTATVSKEVSYENVHVLSQTPQLIALLT